MTLKEDAFFIDKKNININSLHNLPRHYAIAEAFAKGNLYFF